MIGLPGIILLLLGLGMLTDMVFVASGLILGITGIYLIIKGFGFEEKFLGRISEFFKSLSPERISFITYLASLMVIVIGVWQGYTNMLAGNNELLVEKISDFISVSADIFLLAAAFALGGRMIDEYLEKNYLLIRRNLIIIALAILIKEIVVSGANFVSSKEPDIIGMALSVMAFILLFIVVIEVTKHIFAKEIEANKKLRKKLINQRVFNKSGMLIGKVSDLWLRDTKLGGLKVGELKMTEDNIASIGDIIVVKI